MEMIEVRVFLCNSKRLKPCTLIVFQTRSVLLPPLSGISSGEWGACWRVGQRSFGGGKTNWLAGYIHIHIHIHIQA